MADLARRTLGVDDDEVVLETVPFDSDLATSLVAEVQQEYVRRYGGHDETPVDPAEFAPPQGTFLVAHVGATAIGCAGLRRHGDDTVEVKRMFVRTEHRRRGHARRLLAALEDPAREQGFRRVVLETGMAQPEAIALYTSAGYLPIEGFGHYKDSRAVPLLRPRPLTRGPNRCLMRGDGNDVSARWRTREGGRVRTVRAARRLAGRGRRHALARGRAGAGEGRGDVDQSQRLGGPSWLARSTRAWAGLRAPRRPTLGSDIAGRVEAVGAGVTRFQRRRRGLRRQPPTQGRLRRVRGRTGVGARPQACGADVRRGIDDSAGRRDRSAGHGRRCERTPGSDQRWGRGLGLIRHPAGQAARCARHRCRQRRQARLHAVGRCR